MKINQRLDRFNTYLSTLDNEHSKKALATFFNAILAFILPFVFFVLLFSIHEIVPFGNKYTLLSFDMQSQYIGYMRDYRNVLLGDGSMIYTTSKAFGGDYLSLYSYYLASPFNYLVVFFQESAIPAFFTIINILKLSLAGLHFYFLMRFSKHKNSYGYLAFSVGYALLSYGFVYASNFMWLDAIMALPICILGLEHLLEGKKDYWVYCVSLAYILYTSWYIGAMAVLFIVLYFFYQLISDEEKRSRWPFVLRFAIFSMIGGFMASGMWVTAFLHFSGTKASASLPNPFFASISMFFTGFLENNYATPNNIQLLFGYITMFTGMVTLAFYLSFFVNRGYALKRRLASLSLMIVFFFVSSFNIFNALFHGGREPSWFPGRFSFILSFLVCYFGALSFDKVEFLPPYTAAVNFGALAIVLPLVLTIPNSTNAHNTYTVSWVSLTIYVITSLLLCGYPFLLKIDALRKKAFVTRSVLSFVLVPLSCFSVISGGNHVIDVNVKTNQYQELDTYELDNSYTPYINALRAYAGEENYRMEMFFNRPGNYNCANVNPMFYSYPGISHYSSTQKSNVGEFLGKIGFLYNGYYENYDCGSTLAINSLLGIKYLFDDTEQTSGFNAFAYKPKFYLSDAVKEITNEVSVPEGNDNSNIHMYENTLALPFGFMVNTMNSEYISEGKYIDDKTYWYDAFEYQNEMFKCLADVYDSHGEKKDIFKKIDAKSIITSSGMTYQQDDFGFYRYTGKAGDRIVLKYELEEEAKNQNLYLTMKNFVSGVNYTIDNRTLENSYWHRGLVGVKDNGTHQHTLQLILTRDIYDEEVRDCFYYEDLSVLKEYIDAIKEQASFDLKPKNGLTTFSYEGHINLKKNKQYLLFTFPKEDGIDIYIDNKKQKIETRLNVFSSVDVSSLTKGEHLIRITYTDIGIRTGMLLSGMNIAFLVVLSIFYPKFEEYLANKKSNKKRG